MYYQLESHGVFPALGDDAAKVVRTTHVQEIAFAPISEIQRFCEEQKISCRSFYLTVWSLVLRTFAETDSVCVGFGDFRASGAELDQAPLKILQTTLSPKSSTLSILEEFEHREKAFPVDHQEPAHNTGVVFISEATRPVDLSSLGKSKYDLLMVVSFDLKSIPISLFLVYQPSTLSQSHAENLSSNITQAMQQVLASLNSCVKDMELLSPFNKSLILSWNGVERKAASLLEAIHEHVQSRPDHQAICAWDGTVSYSQLDILATRWASYLQSRGVQPGCLVPIMMEHSKWAIIGEIAILKVGAAFVPIDPAHPISRLKDIVQRTKAKIALSSGHLVEKLSSLVDTVVEISDQTTVGLTEVVRHGALSPVPFDRTAYVLFTSGSTGQPKGCVVSYRAFSDVVHQTPALKIDSESRVLQFASYTYGMSLIEVHCTLAAGATICIPSDYDRLNALNSAIQSMQVTWAILTASTTLTIAESAGCLRTLVVAGEPIGINHVHSLADKTELLQAFGLTEWGGICCVSHRIRSEGDVRLIGRSPTAKLWLVDPTDGSKLAPVGAVAELFVEGPALADGYLEDPNQTAAVFIKHPPWLPAPRKVLLYRTGDLVRYTGDGSLLYIARKDSQVKIRGMRVELEEVEYQIRQAFPALKEAIAVATTTKDSNGMPMLAAFLYMENQLDLSGQSFLHMLDTIKTSLRNTLPDYMWPSVYIPLDSVPLTISRKIDRKDLQLRVQKSTRMELEENQFSSACIRAPQADAERDIHRFVAELLHLDPLSFGMDQNFLNLGGDSVSAMRLVNKCKKQGYRVTVGEILEARTISDIVSLAQNATTPSSVPPTGAEISRTDAPIKSPATRSFDDNGYATIPRLSQSGPVEQSFSQARMWFLEELHPGSSWYILPYATHFRGSLQLDHLEAALSALSERHETLRTTFESRGGTGLQIVAPFRPKPLEVIELPSDTSSDALKIAIKEQMRPMDLTKETWRSAVLRLSPTDHVFCVVFHHIISDGWSVDVFMKTLEKFYSAAIRGQQPLHITKPLQIQYRDFSIWQRQEEQRSIHQKQIAYWVQQLHGSKPAEFLCDKPRPAKPSNAAGYLDVKIDGELYQALKIFCRSQQVTPFNTLLAAFRAAHYRLTGASDATIGVPSASRTRPELEELIGYFGNVQCIRTVINKQVQSFQQLVQQVQSATTAASQNQDVPFDQVVSRLLKERDTSRHPLVQITFVLHSQADFGQLHLEGLRAEYLHLPQVTRLDLEFHLYPRDDYLQGEILYSVDLFNPETIRTLCSVFYDVLSQGLCHPDTEIGSLMLKDAYPVLDQRGLIYPAYQSPSQGCSIIDMFQQQVAAHGDQMAITDTHTQLTYCELDRRSAMLATWLNNSFSFVEETPVGVFGNRSCESIIAILGILKAGLAYVPLDVDAPPQRTETILSCLPSCQLVLLVSGLIAPPTLPSKTKFAYVSDSSDVAMEEVDAFLKHPPTPRSTSLSYIVFTSGTTGTPKGVMVEHRGVVRLAKDPEIVAHTRDFKVASHVLSPAFDASGFEVYATLLNGGTLVCIDKSVVWDYAAMGTTLVKHGVQRAFFTTAMLKQCLLSAPYIMTGLEIVYVGGDKLDPNDIVVARRFGKARIFNVYGPTENSVVSTRYAIPDGEAAVNGMPIGRSIDGSGAYVVDPNLRLVPIGAMGELVVTGLGLARGYTNPEQNIGRFVTVSIGGQVVRAYRTGDMVRYRPSDAQLEFFGRMDQQVKIRGYRVELTEIDNALTLNRLVNSAVTVLQAHGNQETELVSFVTIQRTEPDAEKLEDNIANAHVGSWKDHAEGDDHYGQLGTVDKATLGRDFLGWVSMYDGEAIDTEVMAEWLEDTIAAIRLCDPTSALEIGTGTGMMLFNLIDSLMEYYGLEPSRQAVEFVQMAVQCDAKAASKVRIQQGTASDLASVKATGPIDLAIVNSVAQYFPSAKYLTRVIKQLIQLHDVNCIFFGDIRSYGLYQEFQASKVLHLYGHTLSASDFSQKMAEIVHLEKELLIDPAFFTALATEFSELIEHVEIMPKRMKTTNELSCYRYTAILHVKKPSQSLLVHKVKQSSWLDFEASGLDSQSLTQMLKTSDDVPVLAFSNIPFRKTLVERHVVNFLRDLPAGAGSAGWSMGVCQQAQACPAIDATELVDIAQETGWQVEISWARQRSQRGGLDAIFHRLKHEDNGSRPLFQFPTDHGQRGLSRALSNDPLALQRNQRIEKELLEGLRARLPSYMVSKRILVLDRMPINNIGKVDRQALTKRIDIPPPARVLTAKSSLTNGIPFIDDIERAMWEEFVGVLGVEVRTTDSFFDCGGHSLMAIKLVSRINKRLQVGIPLSDLFQYPSISRLAERVRGFRASSNSTVSYQPFSLLSGSLSRLPSIDSALGSEPHPPPSTEIIDILPVTESQAWFLADWSLVSHSFRIEGALDIDRLRAACRAVVQHHATLRTVFAQLLGRLVQVVCGSFDAPFVHMYTDGDLESDCRFLCAADCGTPSGLTTGFTLISRSSIEHIFILQVSHAHYDGLSLSSILSDLAAAYAGSSPLPSTAPFSGYVHAAVLSRSAALNFWKKYLEGSVLTTLRSSNTAIGAGGENLTREAVGKLSQLADITFSTILNAAIAITLANLVNRNDVTFACVMSSRGVLTQGADSVLGPCVSRTLIRVQLSPDSTALEFCRGLRENQARVSAQNHCELGDVLEDCASWPSSDRLAPWVTHLPADTATSTLALPGSCVTYRSTDVRINPRNQILVRSIITDRQEACIQVQASSTVMDSTYAFSLASKILNTAQALSMSAEKSLHSIGLHE